MDMTPTKRDQTLDALKGVAIFLVMLGHVINLNHMEDGYLYDGIRAVQMPLFMMISGYLCGMGRRVVDLRSYGQIIGKRAVSYLVPFFMWIMILYPLELPGAIVDTLFHLDYGLWFLMILFLLSVMVYTAQLIAETGRKRSKVGEGSAKSKWIYEILFWGSYALMAGFVVAETMLGWEFLSPGLTRLYIPFYMAGYIVTANGAGLWDLACFKDLTTEKKVGVQRIGKAFLALISAVVFFFLIIDYDLLDVSSVWALLRQLIASFTGSYLLFWLSRQWIDGKVKKAFAWLGNYTLEIYVLHFHFATLLNKGISYRLYSLQGLVFTLASFAVMSLITAAIIFVTKKIRILDFLLYGKGFLGKLFQRKEEN